MARTDWAGLNENLTQGINSVLAQRLAERNRQQGMSEALQKMIMEAQVKAQFDPEAQFRQQVLKMLSDKQNLNGGQVQDGMAPRLKGINLGGMNLEFPQTQEEFQQEFQQELVKKGMEQSQTAEMKAKVPTVQQRNDLMNARNQLLNVQQMENLARNVPSGFAGIGSIGLEAVTRGGMATNTRLYLKQFPAFAVGLYRGLTGDTRLSDADALRRALPLLWHPSESGKIKKQSFNNIRKALNARIKLIQSGRYQSTPDGQFMTPLEDVLSEAGIGEDNQQGDSFSSLWE